MTATVACGIWSAFTFARLSRVVGESLRDSQSTIDLAARLASALEREDDALLLAIAGDRDKARGELVTERRNFDDGYASLTSLLVEPEERTAAASLREHVAAYRAAGDDLVRDAEASDARERYHRYVNPLLREAVADCSRVRELNFRAMQTAGLQARDVASRSTDIVAGVSVIALIVSILVSLHLARAVARPIRELTESVDALREGDFERRVEVRTADEIGRLAEGFNRMAGALFDFRRSNLGEVLRAKGTLEATLAALPDSVIVLGPDESIEAINPSAAVYLHAREIRDARALDELGLPPQAVSTVRRALRGEPTETGLGDLSQALEIDIDGRARRLLPIAAPVRELEPGRAGAILVLYDVSAFARLDELRTELIAVASHELKTPLTTLRMNLMLLGENALAAKQREVVTTALLGCEQLASTVEELLDVTRIEAGRLRLDLERLDLRAAIDRAASAQRSRFDDARVKLEVTAAADSATLVRGDSARIAAVLSNLLDNALKYTPAGGSVSIAITSGQNARSPSSPTLQVAVTDSGSGVPAEFRERIFEKFFRVEHERRGGSGFAQGAGIGLYLCRQIVEAHGGSIRCEGGPHGVGTRFVFELPAEPVDVALASVG